MNKKPATSAGFFVLCPLEVNNPDTKKPPELTGGLKIWYKSQIKLCTYELDQPDRCQDVIS